MLVGFDHNDDAGVYRHSADLSIVQTADFITPVVDDAYTYGQIAAANSLSDIYAMGARPMSALNLVMFDSCHFGSDTLEAILQGGMDTAAKAGAAIVGGHTIEDIEMKYGLSVTGTVHPDAIIRNNTARPGDVIVLTKPLGSGILSTAIKAQMASASAVDKVSRVMGTLNARASFAACECNASAMTDVTGFGLLGHLYEMCNRSISIEVDARAPEILPEVLELASMGIVAAGSHRNKTFLEDTMDVAGVDDDLLTALCDAQTSGGLLIAVKKQNSAALIDRINEKGVFEAKQIAQVVPRGQKALYVR